MNKQWIVSFLIEYKCMCVVLEGENISQVLHFAEAEIEKKYGSQKYFIYEIGISANHQKAGRIFEDPVMEPGDFKDIEW